MGLYVTVFRGLVNRLLSGLNLECVDVVTELVSWSSHDSIKFPSVAYRQLLPFLLCVSSRNIATFLPGRLVLVHSKLEPPLFSPQGSYQLVWRRPQLRLGDRRVGTTGNLDHSTNLICSLVRQRTDRAIRSQLG